MTDCVLITGASGKIGRHAARAFRAAGWEVRTFRRGDDMVAAAQGCGVIVNGMNPPNYRNWAGEIPQITARHIAAAQASGATVIIPGNVYNYGTQAGPWGPETPQVPCSRKGAIRAEMEAAYRASGVRTVILRAGNFIDPETSDDVLGLMHLSRLSKGVVSCPGRPEAQQSWCYLPDWAQAAVALAAQRAALEAFADIPFAGHDLTVAEMVQHLEPLMGRSLKVRRFPWWAVRLARPFWPLGRELLEMRYLWDLDHSLSPAPLKALLPEFRATALAEVLRCKLP